MWYGSIKVKLLITFEKKVSKNFFLPFIFIIFTYNKLKQKQNHYGKLKSIRQSGKRFNNF